MSNRPKRTEKDCALRRTSPRRRSRSPAVALLTSGQDVVDDRICAWDVGRDDAGHLRGARKKCYLVAGKLIPRHRGRACQELGSSRFLPRRAPGRRDQEIARRVSGCPNKG